MTKPPNQAEVAKAPGSAGASPAGGWRSAVLTCLFIVVGVWAKADSDIITATLSCSDSGSIRWDDACGWQTLSYNIDLHFTLQGVYAQPNGDLSLYQLTNKVGSIHFWGSAQDVFLGSTDIENFDFHQSLQLGDVSGVLHYLAKSNRVTYAGFSLARLEFRGFQPYHVRYYDTNNATAPFARVYIDLANTWVFDDYCDGAGSARVRAFMLTFDDGPMSGTTDTLLSKLSQIHAQGRAVKTAFFMVGDNDPNYHAVEPWHIKGSVVANPGLVKAVAQAQHILGNHTQHHADSEKYADWYGTNAAAKFGELEITPCQEALTRALGQATPRKLFRPPYLNNAEGVKAAAAMLGFQVVLGQTVGDFIYGIAPSFTHVALVKGHAATVLKNWEGSEPCVLIFHDIFPEVCDHMDEIVEFLRSHGYTLVDFDPDGVTINQQFTQPTMTCKLESFGTSDLYLTVPMPFTSHVLSLESADTLSTPTRWRTSDSKPMLVDDMYVFPISKSSSSGFYRTRLRPLSP